MILRLGLAALASALALGCTSAPPPEQQWTRQGATPEDIKRDLYWCTTNVLERGRALDTPAHGQRRTERKVDDECMEKRGYTKVPTKG